MKMLKNISAVTSEHQKPEALKMDVSSFIARQSSYMGR